MALSLRLWRLLPLRRGAERSVCRLTRTWGSRGRWGAREVRASEVVGNTRPFKRGLLLSALSYLGFETYQVISQAAVVHAAAKVEEILEQADYLYESGETEKLYQLLIQYKESEDGELLWRLARASRDIAQLSKTSEEEKKVLVYEALEYAKRALEKKESSFAAHKFLKVVSSLHVLCPTRSKSLKQGSLSTLGYRQAKVGQEHMSKTAIQSVLSGYSESSCQHHSFSQYQHVTPITLAATTPLQHPGGKIQTCPLCHIKYLIRTMPVPVCGSFYFT
ncbi:regulator of microtubule dynamics protein 1 isoform X2 [Mastomys coucha]|uniref:regulator of microtubule dynamics protein 1 isoform X2 n=1 Tax=Mastomys coucha TaxID=35658 RepID=UPI001261CD7D|nr:regulator of microtubule dynamics protein 1 isoform X2 [Mastomys coucha]